MTDQRLVDMASAARDRYLRHYRAVLAKERSAHGDVVAELLIEVGGPSERLVRKLLRVDVIWGDAAAPNIIAAQDSAVVSGHGSLVTSGLPPLQVSPFVWNACEFVWPSAFALSSDFDDWYERWMDLAEVRLEDGDGLSGVIHSIASPTERAGGWGIEVDFGSAPVEAMLELLQLSLFTKGEAARLGSFSYA